MEYRYLATDDFGHETEYLVTDSRDDKSPLRSLNDLLDFEERQGKPRPRKVILYEDEAE